MFDIFIIESCFSCFGDFGFVFLVWKNVSILIIFNILIKLLIVNYYC